MSKARDIADGAANINLLDDVTAGTVAASKVIAADSNKDVASFRNVTLTGELDAATLDVSGNADIDGVLETDGLSINGTSVTATAAELNILDGVTSTAAELNILDGVTATAAELNYSDGVTSNIQTQLDAKQALDSNLTSFVSAFTLPTSDGSNGQVLTTNGSGTLSLADAGGGAWNLISTVTVSSSVAAIDFTSNIDSTYKMYAIFMINLNPVNSGNYVFAVRLSSNGGSSFESSSGFYSYSYINQGSQDYVTSESMINITDAGLGPNDSFSGIIYINDPSDSSTRTTVYGDTMTIRNSSARSYRGVFAGQRNAAGAHNAIRIYHKGGNVDGGIAKLYGIS